MYAENQSLANGWDNQKKYIVQTEHLNQELYQQLEKMTQENIKLAEAWQTHVEYISKLENQIMEQRSELTKLADAWNEHDLYIRKLEQKVHEK
ncbi:hypothetical protein [Cohnella rhizosphaerae]|uniref:Uncharacterized protein n=1 Tax=Cohnella rhizosphaerae TaxID=1457232 RepID=A0A9X4QU24_9BACL|nr:hypothetical protein [Cohnella rhizosphaerae]MDG0811811.1 hypothetical protein [Cohnella rhizosphaerae]